MRWIRSALLATALSMLCSPQANAAPRERTERQEYFLGDLVPDCWLFTEIAPPPQLPIPSNRGGACFRVRAFEVAVAVEVEDGSGLPVAGIYQFETDRGSSGTYKAFCESFAARVPVGAGRLVVFVNGPANGALLYGPSTDSPACLERGSMGWGTTGTITARFKRDPRYF